MCSLSSFNNYQYFVNILSIPLLLLLGIFKRKPRHHTIWPINTPVYISTWEIHAYMSILTPNKINNNSLILHSTQTLSKLLQLSPNNFIDWVVLIEVQSWSTTCLQWLHLLSFFYSVTVLLCVCECVCVCVCVCVVLNLSASHGNRWPPNLNVYNKKRLQLFFLAHIVHCLQSLAVTQPLSMGLLILGPRLFV